MSLLTVSSAHHAPSALHSFPTRRSSDLGTWTTDFRADLPKIDVPMLVLHGDADQVLPLDKTAKRLPGLIKDMQLTVIEGGPRSEEHTSELQSLTNLVCRLLLEKKNKKR